MPCPRIPGSQDQGVPIDGVALLLEAMIHVASCLLPKEFKLDSLGMFSPLLWDNESERKFETSGPKQEIRLNHNTLTTPTSVVSTSQFQGRLFVALNCTFQSLLTSSGPASPSFRPSNAHMQS